MLTSDLIRARLYQGAVKPSYVKEDEELLRLAETLIDIFERHVGRPRHELDAELKEQIGSGTEFLLHRGLAKLLYDRCELDTHASVEPEVLRQIAFETAARAWRAPLPAADGEASDSLPSRDFHFDRAAVIQEVVRSHEFDDDDDDGPVRLDAGRFEHNLYADLKDQQILQRLEPCTPEWLLRRYNTALAQAVLLRAVELEIDIRGQEPQQYRALWRKIKFFQLLYRVKGDANSGYQLRLDGPLSLFQSSQRYGLQMASFLPTLLHFRGWTLEASVRWGKRRRVTFQLDDRSGLTPHTRLSGQWQPEEVRAFPEQFRKLESDWRVSEDGELLDLGGEGVLVPDFVFEHPLTGTRVAMEVFGFWNRGAVKGRLRLLRKHGPKNLLLGLSKALAAGEEVDELEAMGTEVYVFRSIPIARRVLKRLGAFL